ncbi:poly A polymerase C-terminal region-like protein [Imleria badia]|nr:poly A polymerase C-terminal region-like protein [Imleria badia]
MATRIAPQIKNKIQLSEAEDKLCTLLDEFTRHLKHQDGIVTACRINGGWVRDKLLDFECNDVDICLEDMMGVPFAERFVAFLSEKKHVSVHKVTKIESNPDQSKHLETARTTLFGIDLDFVNLRSEEYSDHSRIPTEIKFGTPLEDALRRDITINTLFYNVHTRTVEDHTEKGLDDLRNGIIRTPLPPLETFRDDPLRVIRCIRFASRFGFAMTPELQDAARDESIQEVLSSKISRERIGEELDKMMKAVEPLHAIQTIHDLSLYNTVFHVPNAIIDVASAPVASPELSLTACTILHDLLFPSSSSKFTTHPTLLAHALSDRGTRARLFLSASLYSFAGITYKDHKQKVHPLVEAVIREGLKLGNKNYYLDGIPALFDAAALFNGLSLEDSRFTTPSERVGIGLLLRHGKVHKPTSGSYWSSSLFFSLVCELVPLGYGEAADACIRRYNAFTSRIEELGLDNLVDTKPLLNGNEVISVLGGKPGPWTAVMLAKVVEWQLENPQGGQDACIAWLKEERSSGRLNIEELVKSTSGAKRIHAESKEGSKKAKRAS